jgi:hypothetical protein
VICFSLACSKALAIPGQYSQGCNPANSIAVAFLAPDESYHLAAYGSLQADDTGKGHDRKEIQKGPGILTEAGTLKLAQPIQVAPAGRFNLIGRSHRT